MSANFVAGSLADFPRRVEVETAGDVDVAAPAAVEPVSAGRHEVAVATAIGLAGAVGVVVATLVGLMLVFGATVEQDAAPAAAEDRAVAQVGR